MILFEKRNCDNKHLEINAKNLNIYFVYDIIDEYYFIKIK